MSISKLVVAKQLVETATAVVDAKMAFKRRVIRRHINQQVFARLEEQNRKALQLALIPVIKKQVASIINGIGGGAKSTKSEENDTTAIKIKMPFVRQEDGNSCGPAALLAVILGMTDSEPTQDEVAEVLKTDSDGTAPEDIARGAREWWLRARVEQNLTIEQLIAEVDLGHPVILNIQAWGRPEDYDKLEDGHYVVLVGYDDENLYFMDPSIEDDWGYLSREELLSRWQDETAEGEVTNHLGIIIARVGDKKGGPGSGNFDHAGRPGQVGGSGEGGGVKELARDNLPTQMTEANAYDKVLSEVKTAVGMEGKGHERFEVVSNDTLMRGAAAESRDNHNIRLGEKAADAYATAMAKPPAEWDVADARGVDAVIHETIHGLGAPGYHSGGSGIYFMEEASTEIIARHTVAETMRKGGASEEAVEEFLNTGPYNPDVTMLREMAKACSIAPEKLAKDLKGVDDNDRYKVFAKALGADIEHPDSVELVQGMVQHTGKMMELERAVGGYDRIYESSMEGYKANARAYKELAGMGRDALDEMKNALADAREMHVDWSNPYETFKKMREVVKSARSDLSKDWGKNPSTDWEKKRVEEAKRIVKACSKVLKNKDIKHTFFIE